MKFKVGDKVKLINKTGAIVSGAEVGCELTITDNRVGGFQYIVSYIDNFGKRVTNGMVTDRNIESVEPKPTKNQRITALEEKATKQDEEIAELKIIVHQLRESNITIDDVKQHFNITSPAKVFATLPSTVMEDTIEFEGKQYKKVDRLAREGDVVIFANECAKKDVSANKPYKAMYVESLSDLRFPNDRLPHNGCVGDHFRVYQDIFDRTPETVDVYELIVEDKPKTANELRGEIIEKAKVFVDENGGDDYHFEIDEKERQILAWKVEKRGVKTGLSTCHHNEVFNEYIGRAIAFGRAENLDVSEFEQAVQPTEFAVGQKIKTQKSKLENATIYSVKHLGQKNADLSYEDKYGKTHVAHSGGLDNFYVIINDTNAIYSEVFK